MMRMVNANWDDINNGAQAKKDYLVIPIGSERASADFLMRATMKMRMSEWVFMMVKVEMAEMLVLGGENQRERCQGQFRIVCWFKGVSSFFSQVF